MIDGRAAEGDHEGVDVAVAPCGVGVRLELCWCRSAHVDVGSDVATQARRGGETCSPERESHVALSIDGGEGGARDVIRFWRGRAHDAREAMEDE